MELFKIRVKNLGRIKDAELGIRPLTVFCGPNNTNKTWVANAIYGLTRRLQAPVPIWHDHADPSIEAVKCDQETARLIDQETLTFLSKAMRLTEHSTAVDRLRAADLPRTRPLVLTLDAKGLSPFLFVPESDLDGAAVELNEGGEQRTSEHDLHCPAAEELTLSFNNTIAPASLFSAHLDETYIWNSELTGIDFDALKRDFVRPAVADLFLGRLGKVIPFPAERNALIEVSRDTQFRADEILSLPGVHFLKLLRLFERAARFGPRAGLDAISATLETKVLQGQVAFEKSTMGGRWVYRSSPDLRLDMPAAASLVRSLGGFYAYVKLFAAPGDLIVIDEPEMNAHPAAQLLLVEVFGMLVNTGVNILLTTHSPYIVDHVNNLTEAAELSQVRQEAVAKRFKLNNTKAFVPLEDVACYEFRDDGEVRPTIDRKDRVIDWSTFGRTSDQVTNLYADILKATRMEQSDAV